MVFIEAMKLFFSNDGSVFFTSSKVVATFLDSRITRRPQPPPQNDMLLVERTAIKGIPAYVLPTQPSLILAH